MDKKEWYPGWDDEKERFFVMEMISFNTKNPKDLLAKEKDDF